MTGPVAAAVLQRWKMARRIQTLEQKKHSWTK
jgi:hypothetical protein